MEANAHREKERKERRNHEEERERKEKVACEEEMTRKLQRAHLAQAKDEARNLKGKWPWVNE